MNNFGVIEVASAKTTNAPGWAYVPDTGPRGLSHHHHHHHQQASSGADKNHHGKNRKRAARSTAGGPNLSYADLSARQEAKVRKELEVLDRDNPRDVSIPIPPKPKASGGGGGGRDAAAKHTHTPNVRKILQSQKTFANHLDDWLALKEGGGTGNAVTTTATPATGGSSSSRSAAAAAAASARKGSAQQQYKKSETPSKQTKPEDDVEMPDAPNPDAADGEAAAGGSGSGPSTSRTSTILSPYRGPLPAPHPRDDDPLLVSRVPPLPSDAELAALLAAPPLTYLEARAGWTAADRQYPVRVFCEVCGYWGRVKCIKCGTRVCALDCLETHREDCVTRYGL